MARRYLEIERIRFGDRLRVELDPAPETLEAAVPALILLPLVENAVRYGIEPRTEGGRIAVRSRRKGLMLVLELEDDGPGFPPELLKGARPVERGGRRSIGLQNCRERLRMLYGIEHSLELENRTEGGARIRIAVPFRGKPA